MRRALPFLFLLILMAVSGCSDKQVQLPRRPKFYRSIVSLSPSTSEVIASCGDIQTLKGRTAACNFPDNMMKPIPIVASVKPDYEAIQKIHPDLIVYDKDLYSDQDIEKLKSTGADFFFIDAVTLADYVKELYVLGSKLAWETRFNDYIARIDSERSTAAAAPYSPAPKVAIVLPGSNGDDLICGTDGFLGDIVKICSGVIVGPKGKQFVPLNAEAFVALNPDVIIVGGSKTDRNQPGLVMADPRFKTITAVKQGRVKAMKSDVLLRRGQRVDELIKALHALMAPDTK